MLFFILISTVTLSYLLTMGMRHYAITRSLIDIPDERSSHQVATPRGGGVAIVISLLVTVAGLIIVESLEMSIGLAVAAAGAIAAVVGFVDDHGHIPARWRLLGHFCAATVGLLGLDGLPEIVLWEQPVNLGWTGHVLACVLLVWLLNLYNFMDGINGIASIEAVSVAFGGGTIYWVITDGAVHPLFIAIIGAVAGFLVWNFPRARIFMGDTCSGFLGLLLGLIAIWQTKLVPELFAAWMILLGVFIVDATVTLWRRVLRGDKFYEAHRSHAYQFASRQIGSHTPVTLAVGAINLFWLLPLALMVALGGLPGILALLIAYAPLIFLAFYYKAGARDLQEEN